MGFPDALLLMIMALGDALLLVYLRYRRREALKLERINRSLQLAVERELRESVRNRHWPGLLLRRAS